MIIAAILFATSGLTQKERKMLAADFAKAEYRMAKWFLIGAIFLIAAIPLAAISHEIFNK